MKNTALLFYSLLLGLLFTGTSLAQVNCIENFENQTNVGNWQVVNGTLNLQPGPAAPNTSTVLRGVDGAGSSPMFNNVDYSGNWLTQNCQFCFDIYYDPINSTNPATGSNTIQLQQTTPNSIFATFVVNTPIGTSWRRVCAPIDLSSGGNLPANTIGQWVGPSATDWDALISNVSAIQFNLDFAAGANPSENLFIDNLCFEPCIDTCAVVVRDSVICDSLGFTYTFSVQNNTGSTVDGIIIDGVFYPNVLIAPNGIYGPVTLNYPPTADTTQCFDIILITDDSECCHVEHCFDLYCPPCVDVVNESIECLPSGDYQYCMTVYNNDPINSATDVFFDVFPPNTQFTPSSQTVTIPPNSSAFLCTNISGPLPAGTLIEYRTILKNMIGDTLNWCCIEDTFSVVIPLCDTLDCPELIQYDLTCIGDTDLDGFLEYSLNVITNGNGSMSFSSPCDVVSPTPINIPPVAHSLIFENVNGCSFFTFTANSFRTDGTLCWGETFHIDFPPCDPIDPIDCFCENLEPDVAAGFTDQFNCPIGTFTPNALIDPCDKVTWKVNGNTVGTSLGNAPFQYTYPGVGAYNICMHVIRFDMTNQIECRDSFCIGIEIVEWCPNNNANSATAVNIFPNPVQDQLNIVFDEKFLSQNLIIRILDVQGSVRYQERRATAKSNKVDVSFLPNGVFFLQIEEKGKNKINKRFTKIN